MAAAAQGSTASLVNAQVSCTIEYVSSNMHDGISAAVVSMRKFSCTVEYVSPIMRNGVCAAVVSVRKFLAP